MSHDEPYKIVTREEQRAAKAAMYRDRRTVRSARQVFTASDHVRADWTHEDLINKLEDRARGYSGKLRQILCTAAEMLRVAEDDAMHGTGRGGARAEPAGDGVVGDG